MKLFKRVKDWFFQEGNDVWCNRKYVKSNECYVDIKILANGYGEGTIYFKFISLYQEGKFVWAKSSFPDIIAPDTMQRYKQNTKNLIQIGNEYYPTKEYMIENKLI